MTTSTSNSNDVQWMMVPMWHKATGAFPAIATIRPSVKYALEDGICAFGLDANSRIQLELMGVKLGDISQISDPVWEKLKNLEPETFEKFVERQVAIMGTSFLEKRGYNCATHVYTPPEETA
jgi:hypothetical protein